MKSDMTALDQQRGHLSAERGSMRGAGRMSGDHKDSDRLAIVVWSLLIAILLLAPSVLALAIKQFE